MTNPSGPPHGDSSPWARPWNQPDSASSESPTQQMGAHDDAPKPSAAPEPSAGAAPVPPASEPAPTGKPKRSLFGFLRDPLSIFLVFVTAVALVVAGLIGAELYARHIADGKVAEATECEVEDGVTVSFGMSPPFLWQHVTGHYTNISIQTAGNRVKDAQEMQAELNIADVRLHDTGDSAGTIGALDATITWPSEGIKKTVQGMIPLFGNLVVDVTTHTNDGTVELKGAFGLGGVIVKPKVQNNALSLDVVSMSGLAGLAGALTKENSQAALNTFTKELTSKYPLGIHPDSVEVTDNGVIAKLSTRNAAIPPENQNPCFANL